MDICYYLIDKFVLWKSVKLNFLNNNKYQNLLILIRFENLLVLLRDINFKELYFIFQFKMN